MGIKEDALRLHSKKPGKISVENTVEIESKDDLNLVYTPGVAEPCKEINKDKGKAYSYTSKGNLVAVMTDGSAVLGLGDIGPEASMPVMEGKANLLKKYGDIDGFPICLKAENAGELIEKGKALEPSFGAINLEDIKAPRCFKVEEKLKQELDIPVFHDDQHGTAIVVLAALKNALKLQGKKLSEVKVTVVGAGASGIAVSNFLVKSGVKKLVTLDSNGIINSEDSNKYKADLAEKTLSSEINGGLEEALKDSDVLIGLSTSGIISKDLIKIMNENPIVFALANPDPEILPEEAKQAGADIVATGRSDFDNQVNNSLAFPGIFKGALKARASEINEEMKRAASNVISSFHEPEKTSIVPETLDKQLANRIAEEVEKKAYETGAADKKESH